MHKLTMEQVKEIRRLYSLGDYSHRELGKMFKISKTNAGDIIRNKIWI